MSSHHYVCRLVVDAVPTQTRFETLSRLVGCRPDFFLQIVASLGPPGELLGESEVGGGGYHPEVGGVTGEEAAAADALLTGSVQVYPDKLSCARMLLAAARTFASQKIKTLISDVERVAGQLG